MTRLCDHTTLRKESTEAGMVQFVCFGGNMPWRTMNVAFRGAKGKTATPSSLNGNLLLNHVITKRTGRELTLCPRSRRARHETIFAHWRQSSRIWTAQTL